MPTILKSDSINKLRSIPYDEFFGKMQISRDKMLERIELAEDIEDLMLLLFVILPEYADRVDELKQSTYNDLVNIVSERAVVDNELDEHLKKLTNEVIDVSVKHLNDVENKKPQESDNAKAKADTQSYWFSQDRAIVIAENEANSVFNHSDFVDAIRLGYTKKRWLTELDEKVRPTHIVLESEEIDIDDLFVVGESLMKYPLDTSYGASAEEIINCRCVCEYL